MVWGLIIVIGIFASLSGQPGKILPLLLAVAIAAGLFVIVRLVQKRKFAQMLRQPEPTAIVQYYLTRLSRMPHGTCIAAAASAVALALYGRTTEAGEALASVSWEGVPPFIGAQRLHALAIVLFAEGQSTSGLEAAESAVSQAAVSPQMPGAQRSSLAFQTHRNLGLVLCGKHSPETAQQLRQAMAKLPLLGKVIAAWGLAVLAKRQGSDALASDLRGFVTSHAPHFSTITRSIDAA